MFKFGDIIIYAVIIISISYPLFNKRRFSGDKIQIIHGKEIKILDANKDTVFVISGGNGLTEVEVRNNMVRVKKSNCRDKYCEKQDWLNKSDNRSIICMPNKVIVRFIKENSGIDAVTE
ncbi:MAG: NusG domain II-containing protein [Candidatus Delongbacteria bacterium]|nr:NusG domain II-containing protein [Candidatus Delongbacteria bacterium]MCG2761003.1 NusG domain II-containing protein [Candidatus Delongbacteria bacterium]